jgi:hypothetical protein
MKNTDETPGNSAIFPGRSFSKGSNRVALFLSLIGCQIECFDVEMQLKLQKLQFGENKQLIIIGILQK